LGINETPPFASLQILPKSLAYRFGKSVRLAVLLGRYLAKV
jgi:hypothetical protein